MKPTRLFGIVALLTGMLLPSNADAQGTRADYERAFGLRDRFDDLVVNAPQPPSWIGETSRFWYRKSVRGGNQFVLVDAATQEKRAAFDHQRLATSLSSARDTTYSAIRLPFNALTFRDDEQTLQVTVADSLWRCDITSYVCRNAGQAPRGRFGRFRGLGLGQTRPTPPLEPKISPDSTMEAYINNYNVWVRPVGSEEGKILSYDGSAGNAYQHRSIEWSPDSKRLAANRVQPGYERIVHYVESSPDEKMQPNHYERVYTKPGDQLDIPQPVLFDLSTHQQFVVDNALFPNPYRNTAFEWREDSRAFTFEYNERGHHQYRVIEVNATTGAARAVISEDPETFFYYRNASGGMRDSGTRYRYDMNDGREIIWMSERDGWSHLYMYDGTTGKVKHQITKGEWVVRNVEWVDEDNRQIWFRAGGMNKDQDPYFLHYYRINFDGSGLIALTEADGEHAVVFSEDKQYYVDTWSRVDLAPVSQLRRTSDRKVLMELERGDYSALSATGWQPPEVFVAKGRDGTTDIWGVIIRPTNFDPNKTYPVIESIYAGPQGSFVPKTFNPNSGMRTQAEIGFIVVQMDGMGTSNRSKAFHDVAWKDLGDAGFPDRILWHKAVAAKYRYYDISRVGIYGGSAGGQNSTGGMLFHGDFYDAAVSAVGVHDNRMDKIWWNELWMSWPLGPQYDASSNVMHADQLVGKLMLVVGELDTNVDPSSTMQMVNALIEADKEFDLLFLPGAGHGSGGRYGERKRFDFFVRHLLDMTPPDWNGTETHTTDDGSQ